jgi:uncharacterized membrane protein YhhN
VSGFSLGFIAFVIALVIYSVIVRSRRIAPSSGFLVQILFVTTAVVVAFVIWNYTVSAAEVVIGVSVAGALSIAFVCANTAIETDSPTQSLVLLLNAHRAKGATEETIEHFIETRLFRDSRLNALIADGAVEKHEDRFVCRAKGERILDLMESYRRCIRRDRVTG